LFNLKFRNDRFFEIIFLSKERICYSLDIQSNYEPNYVIAQNVVQYGKIGSGKTETIRSIVEKAVEYYGEDNVNAVVNTSGSPYKILSDGIDNKLVQILIFDDATVESIDKSFLKKYFRIRHLYKDKTGNKNGYIITIFNTHRFHTLQKEIRSSIDIGIWRSSPTSPYDQSIIRKFVGDDGIEDLNILEEYSFRDPNWNSISLFTSRKSKGLIKLDLAKKNYITDISTKTGKDFSFNFNIFKS